MRLTIPAGKSVRHFAEQLGVSVSSLAEHAGIDDIEAVLNVERLVDVPDGFLDRHVKDAPLRDIDAGRHGGMNPWLALDIERRRTEVAGGLKAQTPTEDERLALAEAWRAYRRFEPDSNDLAIDLWQVLTRSQCVDVRAEAYGGQACAFAQRHLLFGVPIGQSRPQALSAARGAMMANPKSSVAHLGMALALQIDIAAGDEPRVRATVREHLERGIELDPRDVWCWAALAELLLTEGLAAEAAEAGEVAMAIDPDCVFALEVAGAVAFARGDRHEAETLFERAMEVLPTYAGAAVRYAALLRAAGALERSGVVASRGFERVSHDAHRQHLEGKLYG